MDNAREKLNELLVNSPGLCTLSGKEEEFAENADWLIANSVTIQKWIPVSNPPVPVGSYLISVKRYIDGKPIACEGYWDGENWILFYTDKEITPRVTHWMPMPEPSKEVPE